MRDFSGYEDLIHKISEARRIARENAPRGSNDDLEAGIFLAMLLAAWPQEEQTETAPATVEPTPGETIQEPAPETPPSPDTETEQPEGPPDGHTDEPHAARRSTRRRV